VQPNITPSERCPRHASEIASGWNVAPPSVDRNEPLCVATTTVVASWTTTPVIASVVASTSANVFPPSIERYSRSPIGGWAASDCRNTTFSSKGLTARTSICGAEP
jgi:hypothetical protein